MREPAGKSRKYADAVRDDPAKEKKGSSPESLHAKTFALDHRRIFVGSFNFDPRSALLV